MKRLVGLLCRPFLRREGDLTSQPDLIGV